LFILGFLFAGAGIATIGFGIPINEFNLGNTMIIAGTIAVAAGAILFGLAAAVDQLTQIANALRPRVAARPVLQPQAAEQASPGAVRPGQVPVQAPMPVPAQPKPPMPAPPRAPVFAKPMAEERASGPEPEDSASEGPFSAIERLRSSLTSADADRRAGDSDAEDVPSAAAPPAQAAPAASSRDNTRAGQGANGAAPAGGAVDSPKKPPLDFLFRSKSKAREPQPEAFDSVWPQRGQRRVDQQPEPEDSRQPAAEARIERPLQAETPPASTPDESRPAAILKSGVVDGMAYTLYADGSIEAQLPQGTVRFGSIAELRSHIENNS
jgi:hypothetical protein